MMSTLHFSPRKALLVFAALLMFARGTSANLEVSIDPPGHSAPIGTSLTLRARGTGTAPLTYKWTRNHQPITNAIGETYVIENAQLSDTGQYGVEVSSGGETAISEPVLLFFWKTATVQPIISSMTKSNLTLSLLEPYASYTLERSTNLVHWERLMSYYGDRTSIQVNRAGLPKDYNRIVIEYYRVVSPSTGW